MKLDIDIKSFDSTFSVSEHHIHSFWHHLTIMQSGNVQHRSLRLCGSSIDARLDEPIPLRIQKTHESEVPVVAEDSSSRHTSAGSIAQLLASAGPLTIMKRRGRLGRQSLRTYVDNSRDGDGDSRDFSNCAQLPSGLDGSEWHRQTEKGTKATKSQSLVVRKVRRRQPSFGDMLKDTFYRDRGPSAPLSGRPWRSDSPQDEDATTFRTKSKAAEEDAGQAATVFPTPANSRIGA
jgi:hypothetical protein